MRLYEASRSADLRTMRRHICRLHCSKDAPVRLSFWTAVPHTTLAFVTFFFCNDLADPDSLEELIALLMPDEELCDQAVASLLGPGLLQQSGLGASLEDYFRGNLKATWFTMDASSTLLQHILSGTAPGSPLADLLYQFVQSQFMRGVVARACVLGSTQLQILSIRRVGQTMLQCYSGCATQLTLKATSVVVFRFWMRKVDAWGSA